MTLRVCLFLPINEVGAQSGLGGYLGGLTGGFVGLQTDESLSLPDIEFVISTTGNTDWLPPSVQAELTVRSRPPRGPRPRHFERLDVDVVHFVVPTYTQLEVPTLFNPYDLRHVHYPEQFPDQVRQRRESAYTSGIENATIVDTPSRAIRDEVIEQYDVDPSAVYPLPLGPSAVINGPVSESLLAEVKRAYALPDSFLLYPAATWPNKNHRRLVEALEYVEDRYGETLPVVCTGSRDPPSASTEQITTDIPESERVLDLGHVEAAHLRGLYHLSDLVVYPSLYEGGGLPVLEAWQFDTPVVCSDIPPLREKGGDAVAHVDPTSAEDIGDTVYEVWTDDSLRANLVERARDRREQFTWQRTARIYHALYRKAAGRNLSAADEEALQYPD